MNRTIFLLGFATLFGFGSVGVLVIHFFQEKSVLDVFSQGLKLHQQLWIGGLSGLMASAMALSIISRRFFEKEKAFYQGLISKLDINLAGMIFLSLCAGIGEEIFFRAAVQPFIGIGWTSFFFVLLHGYLNPKNLKLSIYGLVMVLIVAGLGYLFERFGIFSAIVAHAVLDMVLFLNMARKNP